MGEAFEPTRVIVPDGPDDRKGRGAESAAIPIAIGDVLNHTYEVRRFIARGGMGAVYEGVNINAEDDRVAIKVMLPHLAADPLIQEMFAKEARTLTRLRHPGLVQYRLLGREPRLGVTYIVTEFVDGLNLSAVLGTLQTTPAEQLVLLRRLAAALGAAHECGAIHRDVSPDNVLLEGGRLNDAKIIDFGIAKDLGAGAKTIVGDGFAGKLNYVAPEQLGSYDRNVGPWTDVYGLALVLLAVSRGRDVAMGDSIADAFEKRQSVPDLSGVSATLRPILARMLEPDPAKRIRSMPEVMDAVDSAARPDRPVPASAPAAASDPAVAESTAMRQQQQQIFISYSHVPPENAAFVRNLAARLAIAGYYPWLDEQEIAPGTPFEVAIPKAAADSEIAIFVTTERWVQRPWTKHEVRLFGERTDGARLIVVERERVTSEHLGPYLAGLHRIEWPETDEDPDSRFWEVICGIERRAPGPRSKWADRGRAVVGGERPEATAVRSEAAIPPPSAVTTDAPSPSTKIEVGEGSAERLSCQGRPSEFLAGEDEVFMTTDAGEWLALGATGTRQLPRLSDFISAHVESEDRLAVGLCEGVVARRAGEGWDFHKLPSPALALCALDDTLFAGTAAGSVLRLDRDGNSRICQLSEAVVALAPHEDRLVVAGAQGLFGQVEPGGSSSTREDLEFRPVEIGGMGRVVDFFTTAEAGLVGLVGHQRLGVLDRLGRVTVLDRRFEEGIRSVTFLGPQRWSHAVLTDRGGLYLVGSGFDEIRPAPLPPGALAVGCCGANGKAIAFAWSAEGRLYRIAGPNTDAERLVGDNVIMAFPELGGSGGLAVVSWRDAVASLARIPA